MRARKGTTPRRTSSRAAARRSVTPRQGLPLNRIAFLFEHRAHAVTEIALQLHGAVKHCAARTAGAFELLRQLFQERRVPRQAVDHGDGLAAAALLFHPQSGNDLEGDRLIELPAALAVFRPAA